VIILLDGSRNRYRPKTVRIQLIQPAGSSVEERADS